MTELDAALNALRSAVPKTDRVTVRLTTEDRLTLRELGAITGRTTTAAAETLLAIAAARIRETMKQEQDAGRLNSWTPEQFIEKDFIEKDAGEVVQ